MVNESRLRNLLVDKYALLAGQASGLGRSGSGSRPFLVANLIVNQYNLRLKPENQISLEGTVSPDA